MDGWMSRLLDGLRERERRRKRAELKIEETDEEKKNQ
jgi:hypothetical protein